MGGNSHEPVTATPETPRDSVLYVVGIGASSGGLSALQTLLASMPADPGFACVIVVHLSPEHESHLPGILQQHTAMPVQQVTSTVALERNKVFVIPPNFNLNTIDTHLRLTQLEQRRVERAPIDHFLRTLAATHAGTAIGVVLTGAGADGAIGLRHVKECGGLTIAQDPDEAEFDSMPRSAIAAGVVDLVLPVDRIPQEILRFCATRPQLPVPDENDQIDARDSILLDRILHELRKWTQHDFSVYRRTTLLRRLRRRMRLHHVTKFSAYLDVLAQRPNEAEALAGDLLLVPSEFFRDQEGFAELERQVIPQILARKSGERGRVRAWSIGCSTGEEAYSLAMLLVEATARQPRNLPLQVFATDSSERQLALAREGIYPHEIAASVSPERLEKFFTLQGGFFRVKRELHDIVLFASHDLFKDPPFGHIDLIVCCNLLSNLQPDVRRGVLSLFHYALEPGGMLLVGPGDEVDAPGLFESGPGDARLFRKSVSGIRMPALPPSMQPFGAEFARRSAAAARTKDLNVLYSSAIERYTPPSVLVNGDNDVVHFSSNAAEYVQIPGGELTQNLTRLVREPILLPLSQALREVRKGSVCWSSEPISLHSETGARRIVLRAERVAATGLILVVFDDRDSSSYRPIMTARAANNMAGMRSEIEQLRGRLQSFLEMKHEGGEPEGDGARAQLRDAADELHSVLEELATSREELQAVNEELIALDDENGRRVRELTQISTDLQHLLASTGVATLFLDRNLKIVRFTPQLGELFGLRLSDIGRPLSDLTRLTRHERLEDDVRRVLEHSESVDREVRSAAGNWYLSRILPYRTDSGAVEGVVLTLIDITERKQAEQALRDASRHKDEFLAVLAHELRNPLAPISSGVEVLKAATGDRRTVERIAATMGRQTRQLVRLVDDLLEVSRISGGKLRLHTSIIGLSDVLDDAISTVQPSIEETGHTLGVDVTDEPLQVEGDAARLTQVLSNLLSNAVRYTPPPGKIVVTLVRDGDSAVLTVKDNGVGIAPDTLTHVFDMFYQGSNARPGPGAGLGIGLTLAKTLVELHKGTLTVSSAGENLGSEFRLRLPLARRRELPDQHAQAAPLRFSGDHRILIVDDNIDAAETLCMLMKSLGEREVHTVCSGAEALEAAPGLHPNIVLLDLAMPEMDGYEVARRMRSQPWGKDLLLVALSGWGHEEHRRRSKEAGFDRHVTKPADLAALQAVLNECRP